MDQLSQQGVSDLAAFKVLIEECGISPEDVERRGQLLKNWLSGLYPNEFQIEANQEVLLRGKSF